MDWKLELIVIPVADVDRAKSFYADRAGFEVNTDYSAGEDFRVVQCSPRGSGCSIALMRNPDRAGAVQGLHLIVEDADAAAAELRARDVQVEGPFHFAEGGRVAGPDPARTSYNTFLSFNDPDGNGWLVQEVRRAAA